MKSHLRLTDEHIDKAKDIADSANLQQDDFESYEIDEHTLGYRIKSLKTGEMTDTGITIYKQDAGAYADLNRAYDDIMDHFCNVKNGIVDAVANDEDIIAEFENVFDVCEYAVSVFDEYFGAGAMDGVTKARFGRKILPDFTFTLAAISHLAAIHILGTAHGIRDLSKAVDSAVERSKKLRDEQKMSD